MVKFIEAIDFINLQDYKHFVTWVDIFLPTNLIPIPPYDIT